MNQRNFDGIVILGFPRSGTTLLRRILETHETLCCPPETHLLRSAAAFLSRDDSPVGYSTDVLTSLRFSRIEPQWVVEQLRAMVWSVYAEICRKQGKTVWVEKSALDIFHIDEIETLCGDRCRYIWLTRHPLDVICSVKEYVAKVEIYYPELHEYIRRHPAPLEAFAHAWADTQARMLQFSAGHPENCMRLRYEDLVADPVTNVQRLLDFIGLGGDPAALIAALEKPPQTVGYGDWKTYEKTGIDSQSVGRHRALRPRLLAQLAPILNPVMSQLGYPEMSASAAALSGDPVRELQISVAAARNVQASRKNVAPVPKQQPGS